MEPSSLILAAIIAVWAAYLVPHWVHRREELAQSRTPDRFSDGLRVLQRRRRRSRSGHRSGDAVLTSPRVVVDLDGELLYIPGKRRAKTAGPAQVAERVQMAEPAQVAEPVAVAEPALVSAASASRPMVRAAYRSPAAAAAEAVETVAAQVISDPVTAPPSRPAHRSRELAAHRSRQLAAALASAHAAARRRAVILLGLFALTVAAGAAVPMLTVPLWAVAPSGVLLLLHLMASRVAAIRSTEHLAVLREQARPVQAARPRPVQARPVPATTRPAAQQAPAAAPDRVARRAIAVGAPTWEPVPVPVPTYTLKPAVFRPEPPPLDLPATASAAEKARGALPRRAEEIERILALDADPVLGLQERKAVNG